MAVLRRKTLLISLLSLIPAIVGIAVLLMLSSNVFAAPPPPPPNPPPPDPGKTDPGPTWQLPPLGDIKDTALGAVLGGGGFFGGNMADFFMKGGYRSQTPDEKRRWRDKSNQPRPPRDVPFIDWDKRYERKEWPFGPWKDADLY